MSVTVRFAPSPTGRLHLGNARTAVVNWLFARKHGGELVLRIDDTDRERSSRELEAAIREDLRWLGVDWAAEHRQSERLPVYQWALQRLRAAGLAYPCYETADELAAKREAQRARGQPPRYDRAALQLGDAERAALEAAGRRPHWRFTLPDGEIAFDDLVLGRRQVRLDSLSDPVLRREDGWPTYLFASIVDDLEMGVTHVIRGEDHLANTGVQLAIAEALGRRPPAFAHLPLLHGAEGAKLSKRLGDLGLATLRERGIEAKAVVLYLAHLGTGRAADPATRLEDLLRDFDLAAFGRAAPRVDAAALERLSAEVVRRLPFAEVHERLETLGMHGVDAAFWEAVRGNLERVADAAEWWRICREPVVPIVADAELLAAAAVLLPTRLETPEDVEAWLDDVKEVTNRRGRALYLPLRLALTAREHGPELKHLLPLIGRERAHRRLFGETA